MSRPLSVLDIHEIENKSWLPNQPLFGAGVMTSDLVATSESFVRPLEAIGVVPAIRPATKAQAYKMATTYGWRVGIYARISGASNGVYAANAPVFTFAPADEQEVKPLSEVGEHWTCVGMVYPL